MPTSDAALDAYIAGIKCDQQYFVQVELPAKLASIFTQQLGDDWSRNPDIAILFEELVESVRVEVALICSVANAAWESDRAKGFPDG